MAQQSDSYGLLGSFVKNLIGQQLSSLVLQEQTESVQNPHNVDVTAADGRDERILLFFILGLCLYCDLRFRMELGIRNHCGIIIE